MIKSCFGLFQVASFKLYWIHFSFGLVGGIMLLFDKTFDFDDMIVSVSNSFVIHYHQSNVYQ